MANKKQQLKEQKKQQNKLIIGIGAALALVLIALVLITQVQKVMAEKEAAGTDASQTAVETAEDGSYVASHSATITVKDYGTIKVNLYESVAPATVQNFVKLAKEGFYDGLTFHRIINGFMIQGGDPEGTGMGGADETIVGEFASNGYENPISHVRGVISMARSQDPDSASSQFFIVQADSTFLDGKYAGFGEVTEGIEVVDRIAQDAQPTDDNGTIPAEAQPVIESVVVEEINA